MQTYTSNNIQKYQIGKQSDLAIASGTATSATDFFSVLNLDVQNNPSLIQIEDAEGNRSTHSNTLLGNREYPFSFEGTTDVDKIGRFLYYVMGNVTTIQDGATGAYQHTFTSLNNVILPSFTMFFGFGAEDYRRLTGCTINKLTVNINEDDVTFSAEGMATAEDNTVNSSTSVSTLTITDAQYQSACPFGLKGSIIRYTFSGTPDLSSVSNGDVLVVGDTDNDFTNATNRGSFIVVDVNDGSDYVDVINPNRDDNTDDETLVTVDNGNEIKIVTAPSYPTPGAVVLKRHACVLDATNTAGLSSATAQGLRNATFEFDNSDQGIYEKVKSQNPLAIFSKNIVISSTFTQLVNNKNAADAVSFRDGQEINRAWRFDLEDSSRFLGSSTTYSPQLQVTIPEATGLPTRSPMMTNDELTYDWTVSAIREQSVSIVLRNEIASYS